MDKQNTYKYSIAWYNIRYYITLILVKIIAYKMLPDSLYVESAAFRLPIALSISDFSRICVVLKDNLDICVLFIYKLILSSIHYLKKKT